MQNLTHRRFFRLSRSNGSEKLSEQTSFNKALMIIISQTKQSREPKVNYYILINASLCFMWTFVFFYFCHV